MARENFRERGYEFVADKYGWHCERLGTGTCIVPWTSGYKAYQGNHDVVSYDEARNMAPESMIFGDQFEAARACTNIWGKFIDVTSVGSPLVYEALSDVSHDNGAGAGHASYQVRDRWLIKLPEFEFKLALMTRDERQTVAIGEHNEQQELVRIHALEDFDDMLVEFFNEE